MAAYPRTSLHFSRLTLVPLTSEVRGVGGVTMKDEFDPEPKVYLAMTVPKFPNYFVVNGPRGIEE